MFNTIIQPTGIYNNLPLKKQQENQTEKTVQNASRNTTKETIPVKNVDKKKGSGFATKAVILAFAAISIIWGLPAIKKTGINKKNGLKDREIKILERGKELLAQGNNALEKDKKALEKDKKVLERDKKIFEKINKTPFLNAAKERFVKVSDFLELKIQKPFKTFMQNHVFAFIKK